MRRKVRGASGRLWPCCALLLLVSSSSSRGAHPAVRPVFADADDDTAPLSLLPIPPASSPRRLKPKKARDKKAPKVKRHKKPAGGGGKGRKSKGKGGKEKDGGGKGRKSKTKGGKKAKGGKKKGRKWKAKGWEWKAKGGKKSENGDDEEGLRTPSEVPSSLPSASLPSAGPSPGPSPSPSAPRSSHPSRGPSPSPSDLPSTSPSSDPSASPNSMPQESPPDDVDLDYDLRFDLSPLNPLLVSSTARDGTEAPPDTAASFYGIKDSTTGIASDVTHTEVVDEQGRKWAVTFEEGGGGRPTAIWGEDGDVVRIEYIVLEGGEEEATFTFVSADGASNPQEKVTVRLPLAEGEGEGEEGRRGRGLGADEAEEQEADEEAAPRRGPPSTERELASTKTTTVSVISCDEFGLPIDADGIEVLMDVREYRNGAISSSYKVRGVPVAPGEYAIPINLPDSQVVPASPSTLCEKVSLAVDVVCAAVNGQTLLSAALICAQLRLPWAFAFCEVAFVAVLFTCATVGRGPTTAPFGPSVLSLLCSGTTVEWGYDRIVLTPAARVPGLPASEGTGEPYSGSPFGIPDGFFVDVATDPRFVSITVDVNPVAGQAYNVDAVATCVPGRTISLSVSGADGYSDAVECVAEEGLGTKSCTLSVPGASAYIRDELEASIEGTDEIGRGQLTFRPRTDGSPIPKTERTRAGGPSDPDLSVIWTGIGDVVYGDFNPDDDYVGLDYRIALSDDGRTMAVAAPFIDHFPPAGEHVRNAGLVRVYRRGNDDGSAWEPLGNSMRGGPDDSLGFQLSLADGFDPLSGSPTTFLAVTGGRQHPDFFGDVRVYYLSAGSSPVWNPLGPAIEGSRDYTRVGESISLANGGRTVATGSVTCKVSWYVVGCVLVFDYSETDAGGGRWTLRDRVLRGEKKNSLGRHVALSEDGNAVAASSDTGFTPGAGYGSYVRAFRWNGSTSRWDPMGQKLRLDTSGGHWYPERSVSLSADGATMAAIGGRNLPHGYLRAFRYDPVADAWSPLGQDIVNPGYVGVVGLSADGTTLCEGGSSSDGEGTNSGRIRVFRLVDEYWVQRGYAIDGRGKWANFGQHCVISANGTVVVGAGSIQYGGVHVFRAETI